MRTGIPGKITQVKKAVQGMKQLELEVYVPLEHAPGEAQVDFGHALVKLAGQLVMRPYFVMALPYSDAYFVQVYERETTEVVCEGHNAAFEHFGGVPNRISYDNPATLVAKRLGVHKRELNQRFKQLVARYLFDVHFCTVLLRLCQAGREQNKSAKDRCRCKFDRSHGLLHFCMLVPSRLLTLMMKNIATAGWGTEDRSPRGRG